MTEFYSEGTIAVTEGSVDFVGTGTAWLPVNAKAGDTLNVAGLVMLIDEITDATHGKFAVPYPGATASGLAYAIVKTSAAWGTNRELAVQTAEMIRMLATVVVERTGIAFDAFGNFAGRSAHDGKPAGFVYLSLDGNGTTGVWTLYIKETAAAADWDAGQQIEGPAGAQGESGLIGLWRGPWATATAYALKDVVSQGGSSYIALAAHTSGTFATDLTGGKWQLVAQKGDTGATGAPGSNGTNGTNGADGTGMFSRVRIVLRGNVNIASAIAAGNAHDGVTLATNDLVLLSAQTNPAENGVYVVPAAGAASRATGFTTYDSMPGVYFSVMQGTVKADTLWRCTSDKGGTIGTTALVFTEFVGGVTTADVREKLTANRTYYVRADGSDSNTGLVDSAGGAFLTTQKAVDVIKTIDLNGNSVTISIGAGTFNQLSFNGPIIGGNIFVTGAGPSLTTLNSNTGGGAGVHVATPQTGLITVSQLKLTSTSNACGIRADASCRINMGAGMEFGACGGRHILGSAPGVFIAASGQTYTISGGATAHMEASFASFIRCDSNTVTISGTPAFSTGYAAANLGGVMLANAQSWTGSATGPRFNVATGGGISVAGAAATYFPGNAAGVTTAPGWCL